MSNRNDYRQPPELHDQWVNMANRLGGLVTQPPIACFHVTVSPQFVPAAQVLVGIRNIKLFAPELVNLV
jgi:hypothetical protein